MAQFGFPKGSVSPDAVQPSAAKAFTRWLFGGADPMDRARAIDMELEQKRRDAAIKQAFLEKLQGAIGGSTGVPMRAEPTAAPELPMLSAAPLDTGAKAIGSRLNAESFDADVPMLASAGPRIDMSMPDVPAMEPGIPRRAPGPPSLRENMDWLLPAAVIGVPGADKAIEFFDKAGPQYEWINGVRIDKKDPKSPKEIFEVGEGQKRVYDESGRPIGVMTVDGYVKSVAEIEGAKTGAQEAAKAQFDVIEVPLQDGRTLSMPRSEALSALRGQGGQTPGAAAPAGGAGGLGVKPSAAQTEYDTGKAKTKVEVEALTPKARSSLDALDRKTDFILATLRRAQGMISGGLGGSAGVNEIMKGIPGTKARDLDATLDTVRAALGFQELSDMRQNSPTGGAVGSLTERELGLLSSLMGSLDQGQDPEQLRSNIDRMVTELDKVTKERRSAFQRQYGAGLNTAPLNTTITPDQARAELARRRAEKGQ